MVFTNVRVIPWRWNLIEIKLSLLSLLSLLLLLVVVMLLVLLVLLAIVELLILIELLIELLMVGSGIRGRK